MQTPAGGSGQGLLRTAEIMDPGEFSVSLGGTLSDYSTAGGVPSTLGTVGVPALSFGFGGWGEMHLTTPYLYLSRSGAKNIKGMLDPQLILKLGPGRPDMEGFSSAFTLYGSAGSGDEGEGIVSGDPTIGAELNLSNWFENGAFHLNFGYEKSDGTARSGAPVRTKKYTGGIGIEKALSNSTIFFVQADGFRNPDSKDNNVVLATGFQYIASKNLGIQVGYGQGFPKSRSEPDSLMLFGLTYSPNGQKKQRYSAAGALGDFSELERRDQALEKRVDALDSKVEGLETRFTSVPADAKAEPVEPEEKAGDTSGDLPRVEVVNASSNRALVQQVLEQLNGAGANVVNLRKAASKETETWIKYREGFSEEAVALGHLIDGNQIVVQRSLGDGIDIEVVVGDTLGGQ